jgi:hypothetical protein
MEIRKAVLASLLILLSVLFRTIWHLGPNIEFVTTASFLAATYLGGNWAVLVPLIAMIISDKLIGNTNIFIFTWSGFILIGLMDYWFIKRLGRKKIIPKQTGMGVMASLFFYLYTNFGVWFLDAFGMYPRTLTGLIECYLMGLPFLRLNLLGNLLFVPLTFTLSEFLYSRGYRWQKIFFWNDT